MEDRRYPTSISLTEDSNAALAIILRRWQSTCRALRPPAEAPEGLLSWTQAHTCPSYLQVSSSFEITVATQSAHFCRLLNPKLRSGSLKLGGRHKAWPTSVVALSSMFMIVSFGTALALNDPLCTSEATVSGRSNLFLRPSSADSIRHQTGTARCIVSMINLTSSSHVHVHQVPFTLFISVLALLVLDSSATALASEVHAADRPRS